MAPVVAEKAARPTYSVMALSAIIKNTHFGRGASRQAVARAVAELFDIEETERYSNTISRTLKQLVDDVLVDKEGARYKVTDTGRELYAEKTTKKKKKVVIKKKKVVKKKVIKKKAVKKSAATKKKPAAKKPVAKKAAGKKPAAKKPAAKKTVAKTVVKKTK